MPDTIAPRQPSAASSGGLQSGHASDEDFRELADNAPVMMWRAAADGGRDWFNAPWLRLVGRAQQPLQGDGWAEDIHPDDRAQSLSAYRRAFAAREPFAVEYRLRRHDGSYRWLLDSGAPFHRSGAFAGYIGSCFDITEQRSLQEHQRVLLAELNHRVKNNLQLIIAFLQLSRARAQGDEAKGLLQAAIGRIYSVGAVQDELHRNVDGSVDLGEYLPSLARTALKVEGGDTVTLAAETQPLRVPLDLASNLGLIVNELVGNALKHGGRGVDRIRLQVHRTGAQQAEIVVADNGAGFASETGPAPSARRRGGGLVEALARRCKATLSRGNDGGAQVRLAFPLAPGSAVPAAGPAP